MILPTIPFDLRKSANIALSELAASIEHWGLNQEMTLSGSGLAVMLIMISWSANNPLQPDKVKLSCPLLAQRPRQRAFAVEQGRYSARRVGNSRAMHGLGIAPLS
jgi:hypothetical protein